MASSSYTWQQPGALPHLLRPFTEQLLCPSYHAKLSRGLTSFTLLTTKEADILIRHIAGVEPSAQAPEGGGAGF